MENFVVLFLYLVYFAPKYMCFEELWEILIFGNREHGGNPVFTISENEGYKCSHHFWKFVKNVVIIFGTS